MFASDAIVRGRRSNSSYTRWQGGHKKNMITIRTTHHCALRIEVIVSNDSNIKTLGKTFSNSVNTVDFYRQCDGVLQSKMDEFILTGAIIRNN
jgi:hypothetical protein